MYSENRKEFVKNLKDYKNYVEFLADAILSLEQILVKGELTLGTSKKNNNNKKSKKDNK